MISISVPMRELKTGLSRYVARARLGEVIEVTSHDKPVARITGIPPADAPGLSRLVACGAATWQGGKPALKPPVVLQALGKSVSQSVIEDRG